jgi:hypothetical protein
MSQQKSKLSFLKKYAGTSQNTAAIARTRAAPSKGAVTIVNEDLDIMKQNDEGTTFPSTIDDDIPLVVEDPQGLLKSAGQKKEFARSGWVAVDEGAAAATPQMPDRSGQKRERHDSDSDDDLKAAHGDMLRELAAGQVGVLKVDKSNPSVLPVDGDLEPPRPKAPKLGTAIEEISEKDRLTKVEQPTQTVYRTQGGRRVTQEQAMETKKDELQRLNREQVRRDFHMAA